MVINVQRGHYFDANQLILLPERGKRLIVTVRHTFKMTLNANHAPVNRTCVPKNRIQVLSQLSLPQ